MKIAICYCSRHHGNTRKVVQAMAGECGADLFDLNETQDVCLDGYDLIGLASGIYAFVFDPTVADLARRCLPEGKPVFFACTYGGAKGTGERAVAQIASERHCPVLGSFGCRGYNTFGPFGWFGGSGKGLPGEADLQRARAFVRDMCAACAQKRSKGE